MGLFPCLQGNPAILSQSVIAAFRWKWKGYCSLPSKWLLAVKACMPSEYVTERGRARVIALQQACRGWDVSWAAAGCVCVQTQSVNSYWTGGGEAARLKGMREKQEGESGGYYGAWLQTVFLTPPIITLTAYPVLSISLRSSSFSNLSRLKTLIFSSSHQALTTFTTSADI